MSKSPEVYCDCTLLVFILDRVVKMHFLHGALDYFNFASRIVFLYAKCSHRLANKVYVILFMAKKCGIYDL